MRLRWASLLSVACTIGKPSSTSAWKSDEIPAVESAGRTLGFACDDTSVDLTIILNSAENKCDPSKAYNKISFSTASDAYQDFDISSSDSAGLSTFNTNLYVGCVAQSESYIQFVLSYGSNPNGNNYVTCITVNDSNWATPRSNKVLSSGLSSITYSNIIAFPPTPTPTQGPSFTPPSSLPSPEPTPIPSVAPSSMPSVTCSSGHYYDPEYNLCENCTAGRYSNYSSGYYGYTSCTLCPAGRYTSTEGSDHCTECAAGKLSQPSRTFCQSCDAGKYRSVNTTECINCPSGQYAPQAQVGECLECPAGSYNNEPGLASCAKCDSGTFSADEGVTSCEACPKGKAQSSSGTTSCLDCQKGTYASENGTILCSQCLPGSFSSNATSFTCSLCPLGKEQRSSGQSSCFACTKGTYAPLAGSSSCTECAAGQFNVVSEATNCVECSAGRYQRNTAAYECEDCSDGYYAESPGTVACTLCPTNYGSKQGSSSCDLATSNKYINPRTGKSDSCPTGAVCSGGDKMPKPISGFWVDRSNVSSAGIMYECIRQTCVGTVETTSDAARRLSETSIENSYNLSCWSYESYAITDAECDSSTLMCRYGSYGPLCGSCIVDYVYSRSDDECQECTSSWIFGIVLLVVGAVIFMVFVAFQLEFFSLPFGSNRWWVFGIARQVDSGTFRVLWSTYQIVQSVAWNLNIKFPSPFSDLISIMSLFSFDFLSLECVDDSTDEFVTVILWSCIPIVLAVLNFLLYTLRWTSTKAKLGWRASKLDHFVTELNRQHMYFFLMLTYLVLPPVSRRQFQILTCIEVAGNRYALVDTSIDCNAAKFQSFIVLDTIFITLYLSIPLIWLVLLFSRRHRLNPKASDSKSVMTLRNEDPDLRPLSFLFNVYEPRLYYWESFEMYRRVLFVGALPLVSSSRARLAALGVALGLASAIVYREIEPFVRASSNILGHVAQYCILLTFGAALVIEVKLMTNFDNFIVGVILVLANLAIAFLALGLGAYRHLLDERRVWKHQRLLTSAQMRMMDAVMMGEGGDGSANSGTSSNVEMVDKKNEQRADANKARTEALKQHLLAPREVKLEARVGAGAFGEVFRGRCFSQPVAIKTMIDVTITNIHLFCAEILLTSVLRHPCIVNFVGACWSRELTCLVLEWVPRGPLSALLTDSSATTGVLRWDEQLLTLAQDICRGMVYLHDREYLDETDGSKRHCILHRDLKPDNVLVTELLRAKIADFGSSRSMTSATGIAATIVGTPLFAAPEIMRGEEYGAGCDIYSYGMLLLDMAFPDGLLPLMLCRWRASQPGFWNGSGGKQPQSDDDERDAMALIRAIWQGQFRPVVPGGPPVAHAPPSISELAARCTLHDSAARPSFSEVFETLTGTCAQEVETLMYTRDEDHAVEGASRKPTRSQAGATTEEASSSLAATEAGALASGDDEWPGTFTSNNAGASSNEPPKWRSGTQKEQVLRRSLAYRASINPLTAGAKGGQLDLDDNASSGNPNSSMI